MRTLPLMSAALLAAMLAIPDTAHPAPVPARAAAKTVVAKGAAPAAHAVLPWIEDDLPRAMADAKARKLPLFVESWAPW